MDELEPQMAVPDLVDILGCFPGGLQALAKASGYHSETIYQFSNANRTIKFPVKRARAVVRAFGGRRACGFKVTIDLLRQAWLTRRRNR